MKIMKKCGILFLLLFMLCGTGRTVKGAAPAAFSSAHPILTYPLKKSLTVTLYKDSTLQTAVHTVSYRKFTLSRYKDGSFYASCQVSGKTVHGWVSRSVFFVSDSYTPKQSYLTKFMTLYKSPGAKQKFKYIPTYSGGYTVGKSGSWYQVMLYTNEHYYLGWLPRKLYSRHVVLSMPTTEQPLADGVYTISCRDSSGTALTWHKNGSISLKKASNGASQKFVLKYTGQNSYQILPFGSDRFLSLKHRTAALSSDEATWKLTRNGGYFVLEESDSQRSLTHTSGKKVSGTSKTASASQNWLLTLCSSPAQSRATVFSQFDPKWGSTVYCNGKDVRTLSTSGCGVVAYVNAIYALNGEYISPAMLAKYSNSHGHYFYMQGTSDTLYGNFAADYGAAYHFRWSGSVSDFSSLRMHLRLGGTAVALVPGHYIAITGYRPSNNTYRVLDSAVTDQRPTSVSGDWLSENALRTGSLKCASFQLFSRR